MFKSEYTLFIIKPDAVKSDYIGQIIEIITKEKFEIKALRMVKLELKEAKEFYAVHRDRPFFEDLARYMASSKIVVGCMERENAVEHWRNVIGATDPKDALEGTIRKQFAKSKSENAVHGSDSVENAKIETSFFFAQKDLL